MPWFCCWRMCRRRGGSRAARTCTRAGPGAASKLRRRYNVVFDVSGVLPLDHAQDTHTHTHEYTHTHTHKHPYTHTHTLTLTHSLHVTLCTSLSARHFLHVTLCTSLSAYAHAHAHAHAHALSARRYSLSKGRLLYSFIFVHIS
jgi:hypothetical protein